MNRHSSHTAIPWPDGLIAFWDISEDAPPFESKVGVDPRGNPCVY